MLGLAGSDNPDGPLHPRTCAILQAQGRSGSLSNQFSDLLAQAGLREKIIQWQPSAPATIVDQILRATDADRIHRTFFARGPGVLSWIPAVPALFPFSEPRPLFIPPSTPQAPFARIPFSAQDQILRWPKLG
jgi:hypothetical protein